MARSNKSIKKVTQKKPVKKTSSFRMHKLGTIIGVALVFGAIGAWQLYQSFAENEYAVPSGKSELVLQMTEGHDHSFDVERLPQFHPLSVMLYGDGTLLCSDHTHSPKKAYDIKAGNLSSSDISKLVDSLAKTGIKDQALADYTQTIAERYPIEGTNQIIVNFKTNPADVRDVADTNVQFKQLKAQLKATCAKFAKEEYNPDTYQVISQEVPVSSEANTALDEVPADTVPVDDSGSYSVATIKKSEATELKKKNNGNTSAKTKKNGKTYEVQIVPVIPEYTALDLTAKADPGKVYAASDKKTNYIWFYASDQSRSSLYTTMTTLSSNTVAFYKQELGLTNSIYKRTVVKGNNTLAWYRTCHSTTGCYSGISGDHIMFLNLKDELSARKGADGKPLLPDNMATFVFTQLPSLNGSKYCSGVGEQPTIKGASKQFSAGFNFGKSTTGCSASYWKNIIPTHELGHNFGLAHTCVSSTREIMSSCPYPGSYTWPSGYNLVSGQISGLKGNSLFFNHLITGRVAYKTTNIGVPNVKIKNCLTSTSTITTDQYGKFEMRKPTGTSYCLRIVSGVDTTKYKIITKNNPEKATSTTYEYQVAGRNCYQQAVSTSCSSNQVIWDRRYDTGLDFTLETLEGIDTVPPSVPTGVIYTNRSANEISLQWNPSTDDKGQPVTYKVYRQNVLIDESDTNSFTDTGLTPSTTYWYHITAVDQSGNESLKSAVYYMSTTSGAATSTVTDTNDPMTIDFVE